MDAIGKLSEDAVKARHDARQRGTPPNCYGTASAFRGNAHCNRRALYEARRLSAGMRSFELKSKERTVEATTRSWNFSKIHWPGWEGETEFARCTSPKTAVPKLRSSRACGWPRTCPLRAPGLARAD